MTVEDGILFAHCSTRQFVCSVHLTYRLYISLPFRDSEVNEKTRTCVDKLSSGSWSWFAVGPTRHETKCFLYWNWTRKVCTKHPLWGLNKNSKSAISCVSFTPCLHQKSIFLLWYTLWFIKRKKIIYLILRLTIKRIMIKILRTARNGRGGGGANCHELWQQKSRLLSTPIASF